MNNKKILVIGGGPAGLMAADVAVRDGLKITVIDSMPTFGRKFLMAGKSGLNLTMNEDALRFKNRIIQDNKLIGKALDEFGPNEVIKWVNSLGIETFTGSTGRVFPKSMKASPLLRKWINQLVDLGVLLKTRWKLIGISDTTATFQTPEGIVNETADGIILALGGASWPKLGSTGDWQSLFNSEDIESFQPSNCSFLVSWSLKMSKYFGEPIKSIKLDAGHQSSRGEIMISKEGIEGGGIYLLSSALKKDLELKLDLLPDWSLEKISRLLTLPRGKASYSNILRKRLKLEPIKQAILREFAMDAFGDPTLLAKNIKSLRIPLNGTGPIQTAISTTGGMKLGSIDESFMLRSHPGVFCAGEMLDWDAPTGGYLLTTCMATGRMAGKFTSQFVSR
ncbi:TIGR03862 family flavoprotein [Paracoccaceae bacterium]|nr:TIGR03862 family flavoprotein [Paracoccaceae bacterium]MDB3861357.1 TIGR03862 family flavoprotein [Paracoccaceae bacterium]